MLRSTSPIAIVLFTVAAPASAHATAPPVAAPTIDLADDRVATEATHLTTAPKQGGSDPLVIFLNYDGPTLVQAMFGGDNSQMDASVICAGPVTPYGDGPKKEASIQATMADWAQFNVQIVSERPAAGDYTMNVIGMPPCAGSSGGGVAPMDCGNVNPNNISFSFVTGDQRWSADHVATVNSQEIAHTLGLDHVSQPTDIMNPVVGMIDNPGFTDECLPLTGQVFCSDQHAEYCPGGGQNAVQELLGILGPSIPDLEPPLVSITSPMDDSGYLPPATVLVQVTATDDVGVTHVDLLVDGQANGASAPAAPYTWTLSALAEGTYTFEAVAHDAAGNSATSPPVTIYIGDPTDAPMDSDDAGEDDDSGGGGGTAALPPGAHDDPNDGSSSGCGCRVDGHPASTIFGFGLLALAFARRRT